MASDFNEIEWERESSQDIQKRRDDEAEQLRRSQRLVVNGEVFQDENFRAATEEDEFLSFKFLYTNEITTNGLSAVEWFKSQGKFNKKMEDFLNETTTFGRCTTCKEHRAAGYVCCGNQPVESD